MDTLADMYDAEQQICRALPKLSMAAQSQQLKDAIDAHLAETEAHVKLVEEVFESFGETPRGKKCVATAGLLEESDTLGTNFEGSPALDAAIISAAQKVEHYEIASYGCLLTWAGLLESEEAADLLAGILEEEKQADAILNEIALAHSNQEALEDDGEESDTDADEAAISGNTAGYATIRRTDW